VVQILQLSLTGVAVILLLWNSFGHGFTEQQTDYRFFIALTALSRWVDVLIFLQASATFGPVIRPMFYALRDTWGFVVAVFCIFLGFVHYYYTLGCRLDENILVALVNNFDIIYRAGFLGDFDLEEMENVDGSYIRDGSDTWIPQDPEKGTTNWFVMRLMLVILTFTITITMMNIYIGMLGTSYSNAFERRKELFWRFRAQVVLSSCARRSALEWLTSSRKSFLTIKYSEKWEGELSKKALRSHCSKCYDRNKKTYSIDDKGSIKIERHDEGHDGPTEDRFPLILDFSPEEARDYIWYCNAKSKSVDQRPVEQDVKDLKEDMIKHLEKHSKEIKEHMTQQGTPLTNISDQLQTLKVKARKKKPS
jgi:hypothetical protein